MFYTFLEKKKLYSLEENCPNNTLQGVLAGKSSGKEDKCLEDQLRDAKAAVGDSESELKQLKTKISHSERELKEKKAQLISKCDEAAAVESELHVRKKDLEEVKASMESIRYEEGQMESLQKVCICL